MDITLRKARPEDIPVLQVLIPESVRTLQAEHYTAEQMEGALGTVFGVDSQLISDGTYFIAEANGNIIGCGGWSRRKTLFGSDHVPGKDDAWLDPSVDPARIRAFFVHPSWARRGIGSRILQCCEAEAAALGFSRLELVATLTGEPLYRVRGFTPTEHFDVPLANGATLPVVRMSKQLR
jgi:GNAT superfamily N-acetyltransferase